MKKNLINDKKRFFISIVSTMLVAYIVLLVGIILNAVSSVDGDFNWVNYSRYSPCDLTYEEGATVENAIPAYLESGTRFPKAIALYDKNGNLVHTSGTIIQFKELEKGMRYCYLDEFLTEDELDRLTEFAHDVIWVLVDEFKYFETDEGEIIPVYCAFSGYSKLGSKLRKTEINISNDIVDEQNVKVPELEDFTIISLYENDEIFDRTQSRLYRKLIERVKSLEYSEEARRQIAENTSEDGRLSSFGSGGSGGNYYEYSSGFLLEGEPYYCVELSEFKYPTQIWYSHGSDIVSVSVFFVIFTLILLYIVSKYYDKTKAFEESKNAFISAMTHEMKTPVAIIQNQCECILENIAPEKNEEYLKSIYDETQKMDKLVTDMLQYNRIATNGNVNVEKCNLSDIVKEETEKYKKQFELHKKRVTLNIKETAFVKCDRNLISLVVDNMLSNTIKHTENGGEVIVTVKDSAEGYKFSVYNSGSTVPENEKDKIWSVLYKTDKSRTERDKSSGVGLAVSAKILDLHKANYGCANVNDGVEFYFNIK